MAKKPIRACHDRILPAPKQAQAKERARSERPDNAPDPSLLGDALERLSAHLPHDISPESMHAEGLVMFTSKKWPVGRTIHFYFMDGPQWARDRVMDLGNNWLVQANLNFEVTTDRSRSDVRIAFGWDDFSWSFLGMDNLSIATDEPTMSLGWLLDDPDDEDEWRRVVVHEFGHMLDFGHEQAHPEATIDWNREPVLDYHMGPPNYWTEADVERQVFHKYSSWLTNFSEYDPNSIMHYPIPPEFVLDPADSVGFNDSRSKRDKKTAALWYPKVTLERALEALASMPGI